MNKPGKTGIARIIAAARYSWQGSLAAWKHEAAFRQELCLFVILAPIALLVPNNPQDSAILIFTLFLVLICELLNSAIEAIVDKTSPEHHPLAGRAKDLGSAAVTFSLINVLICWGLIFYPYFAELG